jgi:heme-NO-binding protein
VKGIIFNLLEEIVRREHGDTTWDDLLEAAQLDGAYSSLGSYPDDHLHKLVQSASSALKLPPEEIIKWFGRNALPLLAHKYPQFFEPHQSARPFLLTLNDIIHSEVRKLYPGAQVPEFDYDASSPTVLLMGYRSSRKLCLLAEGFTEAAAAHYGEILTFVHLQCVNRGDEKCLFKISFTPKF